MDFSLCSSISPRQEVCCCIWIKSQEMYWAIAWNLLTLSHRLGTLLGFLHVFWHQCLKSPGAAAKCSEQWVGFPAPIKPKRDTDVPFFLFPLDVYFSKNDFPSYKNCFQKSLKSQKEKKQTSKLFIIPYPEAALYILWWVNIFFSFSCFCTCLCLQIRWTSAVIILLLLFK